MFAFLKWSCAVSSLFPQGKFLFASDRTLVSADGALYVELHTDESPGGRGFNLSLVLTRTSLDTDCGFHDDTMLSHVETSSTCAD